MTASGTAMRRMGTEAGKVGALCPAWGRGGWNRLNGWSEKPSFESGGGSRKEQTHKRLAFEPVLLSILLLLPYSSYYYPQ